MIVSVTRKHINSGVPNDECDCPIAKALSEILPNYYVNVTSDCIIITNRKFERCTLINDKPVVMPGAAIDLPKEALRFIQSFDFGDPVEPFEFEIN